MSTASMSMVTDPTPEQIATVQKNLANMQDFNDYVYNQGGQERITNAYTLLSQTDSGDPGLATGLKLLIKAFSALMKDPAMDAAETDPIVNKGSTFLTGMLSSWSTNPPDELTGPFSTLQNRVQKTCQAIDDQLAVYWNYVSGNWGVYFSANGQTVAISDLADPTDGYFPVKTDLVFGSLVTQALFGLDQSLWPYILAKDFYWTQWEPSQPPGTVVTPADPNTPPLAWVQASYAKNPADYMTWQWYNGHFEKGWLITEYSLGGEPKLPHRNTISNAACTYLFIDSTDGVVINKNGLFPRKTVFGDFGIQKIVREA